MERTASQKERDFLRKENRELREALIDTLDSLDAGGEQSRSFAAEILVIQQALGTQPTS